MLNEFINTNKGFWPEPVALSLAQSLLLENILVQSYEWPLVEGLNLIKLQRPEFGEWNVSRKFCFPKVWVFGFWWLTVVFQAWIYALDDYIGLSVWKLIKHCWDIWLECKMFGKKMSKVRSLKPKKVSNHWKFLLSILWYGYSGLLTAKTHWLSALCCMVMTFLIDVHIILLDISIVLVSKLYTP